jgi:sRNA-binding regulator protein Hfq
MAPKATPQLIADEMLEKLREKDVSVYLVNGCTLHGKLLRFDAEAIIISPQTVVLRTQITTFHEKGLKPHDLPSKPRRP